MSWRVVGCVDMVGGGGGRWCLAAIMVVGAAMVVRVKCKEFVSRKRRDVPSFRKVTRSITIQLRFVKNLDMKMICVFNSYYLELCLIVHELRIWSNS